MTDETAQPTSNQKLPGAGAEQFAELFHATYERLAPEFGYTTRTDTRRFDRGSHNGKLMIAVCDHILTWLDEGAPAEIERLRAALEWFVAFANDCSRGLMNKNQLLEAIHREAREALRTTDETAAVLPDTGIWCTGYAQVFGKPDKVLRCKLKAGHPGQCELKGTGAVHGDRYQFYAPVCAYCYVDLERPNWTHSEPVCEKWAAERAARSASEEQK
jgi:hypothetical protein